MIHSAASFSGNCAITAISRSNNSQLHSRRPFPIHESHVGQPRMLRRRPWQPLTHSDARPRRCSVDALDGAHGSHLQHDNHCDRRIAFYRLLEFESGKRWPVFESYGCSKQKRGAPRDAPSVLVALMTIAFRQATWSSKDLAEVTELGHADISIGLQSATSDAS